MEDLHWIDASSDECLTALVERMAGAAILVLLTYRPGYRPPWVDKSYATQISLQPLTPHDSWRVVQAVLPEAVQVAPLVPQLLAKAEGNPFFLEELARTVVEQGADAPSLTVPETVQAVLTARMDRLPATAKRLLQATAVIGKDVTLPLLQAVTDVSEEAIQEDLRSLQAAEFLYETYALTTPVYTFKHVLTQEVAYHSLVRRARQRYHTRIAQVLEAQFPEIAEAQPELLAHHYTQADRGAQAIHYWQCAGQQAIERAGYVEAVSLLSRGLALVEALPNTPARAQQELALQMALGPAVMAVKGTANPEVEQTYARARALCQQVGDTPQLFQTLWGLCRFYRSQGALLTARELGEQLEGLAECAAAPRQRLEAHDALGTTLFYLGDYAAARKHVEQGMALTDPTTQRSQALRQGEASGLRCLGVAAQALWCLGYPAQAVQRSQAALAQAQKLAHPYSLAAAQHWATSLHYRRREALAVHVQAEALLALATAQQFPVWVGHGTCWHGWVRAMQSEDAASLTDIRQGMTAVLTTGQALFWPLHVVLLAETAGHVGQVEEGLRLLAEALTIMEANGQGDMLAEAYRLYGALLLRQSVPDALQAEAYFQQALAIARRQQAKSWELRAAVSLARQWQQQGQRAEAYDLLTPIYGWFTEGFDTADLQEAKALLKELA
jgi:predicted ATPase